MAAGLLILTPLANAGPVGAAPATAAPGQAGGGDTPPTPVLELAAQTTGVGPVGDFFFGVELPADVDRTRTTVRVTVHDAVRSRSQLHQMFLGASPTSRRLATPFADVAISSLPAGSLGDIDLRFAVRDRGPATGPQDVVLTREGVYPVVIRLLTDGVTSATLTTFLVRWPAEPGPDEEPIVPLAVALGLRVGANLAHRPDGRVGLDPDDLATLTDLIATLADHEDVPLTLLIQPETLDGLSASVSGAELLERLAGAVDEDQVVSAPYVPLDPAGYIESGLGKEATELRVAGEETLERHLDVRADATTALLDESATTFDLDVLRESGIDRVVLPEGRLEPVDLPLGLTLTRPFEVESATGRRLDAVMADNVLAAHFASDDPVAAAHRLLADLSFLHLDQPGRQRGAAVMPPDGVVPDPRFLEVVLDGLSTSPVLHALTTARLFDSVESETTEDGETLLRLLKPASERAFAGDIGAYRLVRLQVESWSEMLTPESRDELIGPLARRLAVSLSADLDAAGSRAYIEATHQAVELELAKVSGPVTQSVTLTAREGVVPIYLVNAADYEVTVRVEVDSDKLQFADNDKVAMVTLPPGARVEHDIQVRSRTPGTSTLEVRVASPDGLVEIATGSVRVRSTAVAGTGIVLSAGALAFLVVWWFRHARRQRRERPGPVADATT